MHAFCLHGDFLKCLQDASESSEWDSVGICAVLKRVRIGIKFVRNSHRSPSACCLLLEKPQFTALYTLVFRGLEWCFLCFLFRTQTFATQDAYICNRTCKYLRPGRHPFICVIFFLFRAKIAALGGAWKSHFDSKYRLQIPQIDLFGRIWSEK